MRRWKLALALPESGGPLFLRIARALALEIKNGRLRPGAPLPGSRELATSLGVHRNTVLAAYRELQAEGWIFTELARGTFVSRELPDVPGRRFARTAVLRRDVPARVGFALTPAALPPIPPLPSRGILSLNGGIPDVRIALVDALARAYRRALKRGRRSLGYGDPRGSERLRTTLAEMLSATRALAASPETLVVTRGSQMGLDLVARTLIQPGDAVAIESLGYRPGWEALRAAGARLVPIPVDESGLDVEALGALVRQRSVRAVYVTPHHQYPTTVVLSPGRRLSLLELARKSRFAIIEDDYDHEFHYDGRPVLPLASADRAGVVIYVGTLSKVLAPGLRVGYVVAPAPVIAGVVARRVYVDRQGDHVMEDAVAELLEDGEVQRHIRRARRAYRDRRDLMVSLLESAFGNELSFRAPAGGTALWVGVAPGIDVEAWARRAMGHGVAVQTAAQFTFDGRPRPNLRLGFAQLAEPELREAVRRLAAALE